jgi:GNAT superfamily N-acetyltransferase
VLSDELRAFAQNPDRFTMLSADVERYADDRVCVIQGSVWAGISGVRVTANEVEALVAEVHERVPPEKLTMWWLDPATEPADLHQRLQALGFHEPADRGALLHALACVDEPRRGPDEVRVRRVETFGDYETAMEVMWEAFATPPERIERQRPHIRAEFEAHQAGGVPVSFLAELDGRPAGLGRSVYSSRGVFLIAGAVVPWARGRGVYRALVRARWDDAVARGTPALVTEAMPDTSYPILKRLGFQDVCTIRRLEDPR